ncbi:MAG: TIGR00269 family protein [Thermoplasmata archaeon]|nr:TIGR00269 family protein [Thermoplasmata archaeon]MCI4338370.1 TIGR00269 family protein [Thermoplasmata archaeon]MCI4341115.1 TIGR00269 family protein [Thermoplasmata archaeon]
MRCDACEQDAVVDQPYRQAHLCRSHFLGSVRDRTRRELHRQLPRFAGGTVAVALSGGKDSVVALELTSTYFARRTGVQLVAITVDEGIAGYRTSSVTAAAAACERLGVEHQIISARDRLGTTTDAAAARFPGLAPCSFCGVWRRQLLNRAARDAGAAVLLLGFNLDDLAQTVLMNLARAELPRLLRMAPHRNPQPGLIPRIAPLARIPEREVFLFATLSGLRFDHHECPHAGAAVRNVFREVLWQLEEALPGTRQSLLRTREQLLPLLLGAAGEGRPGTCEECGEPSTGPRCRACAYLGALHAPADRRPAERASAP